MLSAEELKELNRLFKEYKEEKEQIAKAVKENKLPNYFIDRYSEALEDKLLFLSINHIIDPTHYSDIAFFQSLKMLSLVEELQKVGFSKSTSLKILTNQP